MEVVPHHPGIEVYDRPNRSATQHSANSATPPSFNQFPRDHTYDPYQKYGAQTAVMSYDSTTPHNINLPPPPPSQYYPDSAPEGYQPKERRSWVLPAVVGVLVAIFVGAAVGGGLGASLKSCEGNLALARQQQSGGGLGGVGENGTNQSTKTVLTSTVTVTAGSTQATDAAGLAINYAPTTPDRVGGLADTCNKIGNTQQATSYPDDRYTTVCRADISTGEKKNEKGETVWVVDLAGIVAYTYRDCLDACSSYSEFAQVRGDPSRCRSFTFRTSMAPAYTAFMSANCWLKNGTAAVTSYFQCPECISGEIK